MNRETENVLLLLVGASTLMAAGTGLFTRYVKPSLLPWLLAGGVTIAVLALAAIVRDIRHGGPPSDDGHAHSSRVLWLLAVPVVVLTFVSPPPIGAGAAGTAVTPDTAGTARRPYPPLPAGAAPDVPLPEVLMRVAHDSAGTLTGRLISVTGFTIRSGDQVDLARVVIVCCAADAQLAQIRLSGPAVADHPDNTWVKVRGTVEQGSSGPAIVVHDMTPVEAPRNPYSY